jgi:hypothetical protein
VLNLRADVESERSISSSVVGLREMIDSMREEMEMIRTHDLEQFASQLKAVEKKNETLSRNTEELIKYANEYSDFTRKKLASIQEDYRDRCDRLGGNGHHRPPPPGFTLVEPVPPMIVSINPQPQAVPVMIHCGFCNTKFSGDVREHKRICWPIYAKRISTTPPSKPLDPRRMCPADARICGDCYGCRHDVGSYLRGLLKL